MAIARFLPPAVRTILKTYRDRARASWAYRFWIERFHSFSSDDLLAALRRLGVQQGDVLIAHTSFARFEGFQGGVGEAIRVLQEAVGEEGALLVPTLPFLGSAVEYAKSGQLTDIAKTPSRMGFITEVFRRLPGVRRSVHPTHPVAGWGRRAAELLEGHLHAQSPCGRGSPFHKLLEADGKILLAGTSIVSMTFYHCIEELIESRMPFSPFTQNEFELKVRDVNGQVHNVQTRLYEPAVSARRDCEIMIRPLRRRGLWHETKVGRLPLVVLRAREVLQTVEEMAHKDIYCYR
jgi:aminoglycoside 3-N-acetyltransferase